MTEKKVKWQCPICRSRAYQRYGGVTVPAVRFYKGAGNEERRQPTTMRMGQHFMCKGCTVFFSNPKLFNLVEVEKRNESK